MSDALPLISRNVLQVAGLTSNNGQGNLRLEQADAKVVSVNKEVDTTNSGNPKTRYEATLEIQGRPVKVLSEQPLAKDSLLKLQLVISRPQVTDESANSGEIVQQIRVLQVILPTDKNLASNTQTASLSLPQPQNQATAPADIAARLKQLSQLLKQIPEPAKNTSQMLTAEKSPSPAQLKSWLAQKLPLADLRPTQPAITNNPVNASTVYQKTASSTAPVATTPDATPATNAQNKTLILLEQLLAKPNIPVDVKQQLQQYLAQLQSATKHQGSQQQIQNSGLSLEAKLVKLLLQIAQGQPEKTAAPQHQSQHQPQSQRQLAQTPVSEAENKTAASVFKQLWQQATVSNTASQRATTGSEAVSKTKPESSISEILKVTKNKLESSLSQAAAKITGNSEATSFQHSLTQLSEQLALLQGNDQKAVLSKSLQLWLQQINTARSASNEAPHTLQQLAGNLQERLPEGFRLLQSALAHIELEQLQRLQQGNDQWQLNIPLLVRQDQQLQEVRMQLFKESEEQGQDDPGRKKIRWRIHLHFDLNNLGPLDVEVDMRMPKMAVTFWSTHSTTLAEIQTTLPPLRSKLSQLGVEVETLTARHGRLPEKQRNQIHTSLVDLHT